MSNDLGRLVKRLRTAAGMTQEELAKRAGVKQTYISHIERGGKSKPGPEVMQRLADALGTTEEELYKAAGRIRARAGDQEPMSPELQAIHHDILNLPPAKRTRRLKTLSQIHGFLREEDEAPDENEAPTLVPELLLINQDLQQLPDEECAARAAAIAQMYQVLKNTWHQP